MIRIIIRIIYDKMTTNNWKKKKISSDASIKPINHMQDLVVLDWNNIDKFGPHDLEMLCNLSAVIWIESQKTSKSSPHSSLSRQRRSLVLSNPWLTNQVHYSLKIFFKDIGLSTCHCKKESIWMSKFSLF